MPSAPGKIVYTKLSKWKHELRLDQAAKFTAGPRGKSGLSGEVDFGLNVTAESAIKDGKVRWRLKMGISKAASILNLQCQFGETACNKARSFIESELPTQVFYALQEGDYDK